MNILDVKWFTGRTCVGAVAIKTIDNKWKAYIGSGDGFDEEYDIKSIAEYGRKLEKNIAIAMFSQLNPEQFDMEK